MSAPVIQRSTGESKNSQMEDFLPYGPRRDDPERFLRAAQSPLSALIVGETGTGKEVVAKNLHALSGRGGKFVALNCGALPEHLIESELYGHLKGAFTGAIEKRKGIFQEADGGTLFLDEITEMPVALQAKLLRALQERKIVPVGSNEQISVDIRVIAATNRDPQEAISAHQLREDLYYRLNEVQMKLPPLRERTGEVVPLAEFFLARAADEQGVSARLADDARYELSAPRNWAGNIRELRSVIRSAFYLHAGTGRVREITADDLSGLPLRSQPRAASANAIDSEVLAAGLAQKKFGEIQHLADEGKRRAMLQALDETGYNVTRAVEVIGLGASNRKEFYQAAKRLFKIPLGKLIGQLQTAKEAADPSAPRAPRLRSRQT